MRKIKNILIYTGSLNSGGAERQLVYTAIGLKKKGNDVKILINFPINSYKNMLENCDIEVICSDTNKYSLLKRYFYIVKIILKFKPDIVHSYLSSKNLEAMFFSWLLRVKKRVASIRNVSEKEFRFFNLYKNKATNIICNSLKAKVELEKKYGINEKVKVVHNGLDLKRFENLDSGYLMEEINLNSYKRIGISIGRIVEQKNHIELVKALVNLFKSKIMNKDDIVLLVGNILDQQIYDDFMKEIVKNKLEKNIRYIGERKDIENLLEISDYLILPSKYEGFPNVVMEAMASETFVIATDVGGTAELVKDKETGILIKISDKKMIQTGIKEYLLMDSQKKELMIKTSNKFIKEFNIENLIKKTMKVYNEN